MSPTAGDMGHPGFGAKVEIGRGRFVVSHPSDKTKTSPGWGTRCGCGHPHDSRSGDRRYRRSPVSNNRRLFGFAQGWLWGTLYLVNWT